MLSPTWLLFVFLTSARAQETSDVRTLEDAVSQSEALSARGDAAGARAVLKPLIAGHLERYALVLRYAALSHRMGDLDTAETYYQIAYAFGTQEEAPIEGLLSLALERHKPDWRIYAERLLKLNASNRMANLSLASDAFSREQFPEASEAYLRVLNANAQDIDALLGLGWCELRLERRNEAKTYFTRVLDIQRSNGSALQGLAMISTISLEASPYFALLRYKNTPLKTGGISWALPLSLGYKTLWTATLTHTRTNIDWNAPNPDIAQREWNTSLSYRPRPGLTLIADCNLISVNDPATDHGRVLTGGLDYRTPLPERPSAFLSLGGYAAASRYKDFKVTQFTPQLGGGLTGFFSGELSLMHISNGRTSKTLDSGSASATLGPWRNVFLTLSGYSGQKTLAIENWGMVAANTPDVYRGGWRAGLSWAFRGGSLYGLAGRDKVRASTPSGDIDYLADVFVAGVVYRFGSSS